MPKLLPSDFKLTDFAKHEKVREYVTTFGLLEAFRDETSLNVRPIEPVLRRHAVDPNNAVPFRPDWSDLARLHWLARIRKVVSVVEIGSGYSTAVLAHALQMNHQSPEAWPPTHLREPHPYTVLTIDESDYWLQTALERIPDGLKVHVRGHQSSVSVGFFQDRICTYFDDVPEISADLVYLDGPSQWAPVNTVRGLTTASHSLMPLSADLLAAEYFFSPGSVVLVDGRTANARFLRANFQRPWRYQHFEEDDFHIFELAETPLGRLNSARLAQVDRLLT